MNLVLKHRNLQFIIPSFQRQYAIVHDLSLLVWEMFYCILPLFHERLTIAALSYFYHPWKERFYLVLLLNLCKYLM